MILRIFFLILACSISLLPISASEEGYIVQGVGESQYTEARKKLIEKIISADVLEFGYQALSVRIDANQIEPRGKMQGRAITLSAKVPRDGEFIKLFIHELAHYIDIYTLAGTRYVSDPSDAFYAISWIDKTTKRSGEGISSFVSWYAATNKYEDFAESFTFYVFHNREFADRAMKNESLRQKYLFFSNTVFKDGEFQDTDFRIGTVPSYLWDTTKVPISVQKYLYSLQ